MHQILKKHQNNYQIMETQELVKQEKLTQKIQLVKGEFTPSEASDIISSLIDEKINFHKIQRLQKWEGNHKCTTKNLDDRITQLQEEKILAKQFISKLRANGNKLNINGIIEISIADKK